MDSAAVKRRLENLRKQFPDEVMAALYQETQVEATEVKKRTPVDKGALRGSIDVVKPVRDGSTIYTLITAGGPAAPYAVIVHETPPEEMHHKVGQWKYLESVLLESRQFMAQRVGNRIDFNRAMS